MASSSARARPLARWAKLVSLELVDRDRRVADALPKIGLSQVERFAEAAQPTAERSVGRVRPVDIVRLH